MTSETPGEAAFMDFCLKYALGLPLRGRAAAWRALPPASRATWERYGEIASAPPPRSPGEAAYRAWATWERYGEPAGWGTMAAASRAAWERVAAAADPDAHPAGALSPVGDAALRHLAEAQRIAAALDLGQRASERGQDPATRADAALCARLSLAASQLDIAASLRRITRALEER
jgi:hypothetical protein